MSEAATTYSISPSASVSPSSSRSPSMSQSTSASQSISPSDSVSPSASISPSRAEPQAAPSKVVRPIDSMPPEWAEPILDRQLSELRACRDYVAALPVGNRVSAFAKAKELQQIDQAFEAFSSAHARAQTEGHSQEDVDALTAVAIRTAMILQEKRDHFGMAGRVREAEKVARAKSTGGLHRHSNDVDLAEEGKALRALIAASPQTVYHATIARRYLQQSGTRETKQEINRVSHRVAKLRKDFSGSR